MALEYMKALPSVALEDRLRDLRTQRRRLTSELDECETEIIGIKIVLAERAEKDRQKLESERQLERAELFDEES